MPSLAAPVRTPWASQQSTALPAQFPPRAERGSSTKYVLWGAAIGGAIGLGIGIASYNNSRCTDCWVPNEAIPPYVFVLGATAGALLGLLVHAMTPESPAAAR